MSDQDEADKRLAEWAKDKKDFPRVRQRMGEVIQTDMDLLKSGRMGLGTVRDGNLDLDHAYDLATRMHPETLAEIRAAKKREQQPEQPKPQRGGEPEKARETITRSLRELRERS
jgi:hypothetical protein